MVDGFRCCAWLILKVQVENRNSGMKTRIITGISSWSVVHCALWRQGIAKLLHLCVGCFLKDSPDILVHSVIWIDAIHIAETVPELEKIRWGKLLQDVATRGLSQIRNWG